METLGRDPYPSEASQGRSLREAACLELDTEVGISCAKWAPWVAPDSWEGTGHQDVLVRGPYPARVWGSHGGTECSGVQGPGTRLTRWVRWCTGGPTAGKRDE